MPPTSAAPDPTPARRRRRRRGCLLGALGLLVILGVAAAIFFLAVLPVIRETARGQLRDAVTTQVDRIRRLPVLSTGEFVITEEDVNRRIRENMGQFGQVSDPVFDIGSDGVTLAVDLLGTESTYRGGLAIEEGRIVVTDPQVTGIAGQILPAEDVAGFVEDLLNDLQRRSNVEFTDVRLSNGKVTIETRSTGTPAAGTPAG
ncbi:MAG TPA: hypothetical protein VGR16_11900 [Thermomicrobiales bacterium]|nr:hypothetical protein [Thermomicrobiales bacterium]